MEWKIFTFCVAMLPLAGLAEGALRLGVVSDLHMTTAPGSAESFERTLRYFDGRKADGVLVCGDLTDTGFVEELEIVARTWFKVFPDGRRSDGVPIAQLFHLGDHDMGGYMQRRLENGKHGELDGRVLPNVDVASIWERLFHEPWTPIQVKRVKGCEFVLAHHPRHTRESRGGNVIPGLEKVLAQVGQDPSRPFILSQHRILRDTVCRRFGWGADAGATTVLLRGRANCIAFCGHGHVTATNDENVWQGGFTAVEVPSLSYCLAGVEGTAPVRFLKAQPARQFYVVEWTAGRLTIERRACDCEFKELGVPWTVKVPEDPEKEVCR